MPLMLFSLIVNPLLIYFIYCGELSMHYFLDRIYWGPLWFVFTLLVFELVYAVYWKFCHVKISQLFQSKPSMPAMLAFCVLCGTIAFAVRMVCPIGTEVFGLQLGCFSLYVAMYFVGILAGLNGWIDSVSRGMFAVWSAIVLIMIVLLPIVFIGNVEQLDQFSGGYNCLALFYAFWEPFMFVGMTIILLKIFKYLFNGESSFVKAAARSSFAAYFIHAVIVVCCTLAAERLSPEYAFLQFGVVVVTSVIGSFAAGALLQKMPLLSRVF